MRGVGLIDPSFLPVIEESGIFECSPILIVSFGIPNKEYLNR